MSHHAVSTSAPSRIMLVAFPLFSWGLERLLENENKHGTVTSVVGSVAEAILRLPDAQPDLIVLDFDNEIDTEPLVDLQAQTSAKVLVLSSSRDVALLDSVILAGARGVVGKYEAPVVLLRAIEKVLQGEMWIERGATSRIFLELSRHQDGSRIPSRRASVSALTAKERLTVHAVVTDSLSPGKVIAQRLNISEHTLRNHLTAIYRKLSVRNRAELHAYAKRHGL